MARPAKPAILPGAITGEGSTGQRLEQVLDVPVPSRSEFWRIEPPKGKGHVGKQLMKVFKKDLSEEEISSLRKEAIQSPGKTMAQIHKLKKLHPFNPNLLMLSAICTHGINMNSSDPSAMFGALRMANKDAASAVIFDGLSLYNMENFFRLYRLMIERYKRQFDKVSRELRGDRAPVNRAKLDFAGQLLELLSDEEGKGAAVVGHLKKKIMANAYAHYLSLERITRAGQAIESGRNKEMVGYFTAQETISFAYAFGVAAAKVPILHPVVDRLMEAIPSLTLMLALRKVSVQSARHFVLYRLAEAERQEERMRRIARVIYQENLGAMQQMETQAVQQPYEADPFMNLASITYRASGLFPGAEQAKMVASALTAAEALIRKDQTKNRSFTEAAQAHVRRLSSMTRETAAD